MIVGSDAVYVAALPVVEVAVLVAQDRVGRLVLGAAQRRHRVRPREQVLHRLHGDRPADQRLQLAAPQAAAEDDRARGDGARRGLDGADAPARGVDAGHPREAVEARAQGLGPLARHVADHARLAQPVGRHVVGREDRLPVQQRQQVARAVRRDDLAAQPVRLGVVAAAVELPHALLVDGHLQAPDAEPGAPLGLVEALVVGHRALREQAHQARGAGLEDEAGGVERGAAGVVERPWSSTTTSRTPPSARRWASVQPTMPAPMTTTSAFFGITCVAPRGRGRPARSANGIVEVPRSDELDVLDLVEQRPRACRSRTESSAIFAPSPATLPAQTIRVTGSPGTRPIRTAQAGERYEPNEPASSTCWMSRASTPELLASRRSSRLRSPPWRTEAPGHHAGQVNRVVRVTLDALPGERRFARRRRGPRAGATALVRSRRRPRRERSVLTNREPCPNELGCCVDKTRPAESEGLDLADDLELEPIVLDSYGLDRAVCGPHPTADLRRPRTPAPRVRRSTAADCRAQCDLAVGPDVDEQAQPRRASCRWPAGPRRCRRRRTRRARAEGGGRRGCTTTPRSVAATSGSNGRRG